MFFGKKRSKKMDALEELKNMQPTQIDIPFIETESIKINKDLDSRDDLYKLDDFFAHEDEAYMRVISGDMVDIKGVVIPKSLKLRDSIGSDGEVLKILTIDEEVTIIKAFNGWYNVRTQDDIAGWCMCCHIKANIDIPEEQSDILEGLV